MPFSQEQVRQTVDSQRRFFRSGVTLDVNWRIRQLKKLKQAVIAYEEQFEQALAQDLGRSRVEAYLCDVGPVIVEINEMIRGLRRWSRPELHFSGIMCFPSLVTRVYKMPYGVTLIISPFNFPVLLTLGVLAASICGGNTAVVKPSSKSSASTAVLKKFLDETFPAEYVKLIDGGRDVADFCLSQRFDKIFYTGAPKVAVHVLDMASKNLTPVTLELGGETGNWCIIRKDADLRDAAEKIAFFKACNSGQICINVNQIAVAEEVAERFVQYLKEEFIRQLGDKPQDNEDYPRMITPASYEKCSSLADKYRDRISFGGQGNEQERRYSPTIIYPVAPDDPIVMSELFNPLLPIVPFKDSEIDSLLDLIQKREHPLAMYIFTANLRWARKVMRTMQYGGGCINEVCLHLMVKGVPFNGVGHSGMGAYHGVWGFREFTHPSTVLEGSRHFNLKFREHPYSGRAEKLKLKLLRLLER